MRSWHQAGVLAGLGLALALGRAEAATTVAASEAYYTFRGTVSSFSTSRLLADKATAIGFPGQDAVSFIRFDRDDLPAVLRPGAAATLTLEHDPALASFLLAAEAARPTLVGAYDVRDIFDPPGAGNFDVIYGPGGSLALDRASVGAPGLYSWDIGDLVRDWLADPTLDPIVAFSGIYGNDGPDPRNGYAIFHTVGSTGGLAPTLTVTPIPAALPLLAAALGTLALLRRRARA
jgi:hypothetical protein